MRKFKETLVTPAMAKRWLAQGTIINRNLVLASIKRLTLFMQHGLWHPEGGVIMIARGGGVMDGQHRLLAIIACGVSQWVGVLINCDPSAFRVLDQHTVRSASDMYTLMGGQLTYPSNITATASMALKGRDEWQKGSKDILLRVEVARFAIKHDKVIASLRTHFHDNKIVRSVYPAGVAGALLMMHLCGHDATGFAKKIVGSSLFGETSPAAALLRFLINNKPVSGEHGLRPRSFYSATVKAAMAWLRGKKMKMLKLSAINTKDFEGAAAIRTPFLLSPIEVQNDKNKKGPSLKRA